MNEGEICDIRKGTYPFWGKFRGIPHLSAFFPRERVACYPLGKG